VPTEGWVIGGWNNLETPSYFIKDLTTEGEWKMKVKMIQSLKPHKISTGFGRRPQTLIITFIFSMTLHRSSLFQILKVTASHRPKVAQEYNFLF